MSTKHRYTIKPEDRKFHPSRPKQRLCWCGEPAVTNNAAGTVACKKCLEREQRFAEGELRRTKAKSHGFGKYLDWAISGAVRVFGPARRQFTVE